MQSNSVELPLMQNLFGHDRALTPEPTLANSTSRTQAFLAMSPPPRGSASIHSPLTLTSSALVAETERDNLRNRNTQIDAVLLALHQQQKQHALPAFAFYVPITLITLVLLSEIILLIAIIRSNAPALQADVLLRDRNIGVLCKPSGNSSFSMRETYLCEITQQLNAEVHGDLDTFFKLDKLFNGAWDVFAIVSTLVLLLGTGFGLKLLSKALHSMSTLQMLPDSLQREVSDLYETLGLTFEKNLNMGQVIGELNSMRSNNSRRDRVLENTTSHYRPGFYSPPVFSLPNEVLEEEKEIRRFETVRPD